MFAIVDLSTNELVGVCGLCYIDWINRNADFLIYIGKDSLYIDEVYAVDAAKVMMKYGLPRSAGVPVSEAMICA